MVVNAQNNRDIENDKDNAENEKSLQCPSGINDNGSSPSLRLVSEFDGYGLRAAY